jgi:selenocysteine-specific elongation factor
LPARAGIQTQTAECLVIGELTTTKLIVVLNKADLLPADTHDATLAKLQKRLAATFAATRFAGCTQIVVSARPGGGDSMAAGGALPYRLSPRSRRTLF